MSHYLAGILKIIVIEAFMALLVIDRLTPEKWERPKRLAFTTLVTAMVFGFTGWGSRGGTSIIWWLGALGVGWTCGWIVRAALGREPSERAKSVADSLAALGKTFRLPAVAMAGVLSAILALGYCWLGVRNDGIGLVHQHEQFHFYLGAKYQKEVGWFDLYIAAIMADRETINAMAGVQKTRDNRTFEEMDVATALQQAPRIRAKFSDERWEAFKADWVSMARSWPWMNWQGVMNDHGNSNSPAWSVVAAPLTWLFPLAEGTSTELVQLPPDVLEPRLKIARQNQALLGCIDPLLMLALFIVIYETFGWRIAGVSLFMFACLPVVFDYLAGSFLRWDWLFALGLAVCSLEKKRWGTAGAFFGYAVATKLFPLFFGIALLGKIAFQWTKERKILPEWIAFARNTAISGAVCVALSTAMFGTTAWTEYAERIQVAQTEKFYSNQHSLKTVFLQTFAPGEGGLGSGIFPPVIKQSLADVRIQDYSLAFWIVRLAFTAVVLVLLRRATDVQAFTMGPLMVLCWLTVNMYYWNMLALLALGLATRAGRHFFLMLLAFFTTYITYYTYQHLNRGFAEGYTVALIFVVLTIAVAIAEFREQRTEQPVS